MGQNFMISKNLEFDIYFENISYLIKLIPWVFSNSCINIITKIFGFIQKKKVKTWNHNKY